MTVGDNLEVSKSKKVYKVNLPKDVMEMIHEALHLEQMGYRISENVSNIALQRKSYVTNSRVLGTILDNYYEIRRNLRPAEVTVYHQFVLKPKQVMYVYALKR